MKDVLPLEPINIIHKTKMIRLWQSRCIPCPNLEEVENVKEDNMSTIGAPLLHTTKLSKELPGINTFNIHGASFPPFYSRRVREGAPSLFQKTQLKTSLFKVLIRV